MVHLDQLLGGNRPSSEIGKADIAVVVDRYLTYYAGVSGHTARAKRADLKLFLSFLARLRGGKRKRTLLVADWDYSSVQRFVEERLALGESPATVSRRLATLKHMGRVLSEKIAGFVNPARDVKPPRVSTNRPKSLTPTQVEAILNRARERVSQRDTFSRRRNAVLIGLLLETGLRADEVRLLRMQQLDERREWLTAVRTKGRRFRNVYIPERFRETLRTYLHERELYLKRRFPQLGSHRQRQLPIFPSSYAASVDDPESFLMGAKSIYRAVREVSSELKIHPHLLRHTFAIELLEHTSDIRLVAQALGHSDVRVTMRYTERRDEEVAGALDSRPKRGRGHER